MKHSLALLTLLFTQTSLASLPAKKIALVYKGPGSCIEKCSESPAELLTKMGYEVKFVGPKETDPLLFKGASLWLQPGGLVRDQYRAMVPELKQLIIDFVKSGGGYVGICAGAFLASEKYSWKSKRDGIFVEHGLNFFPGQSTIFDAGKTPDKKPIEVGVFLSSFTNQQSRYLYWEEGPVFTPNASWLGIEIISRYPNNQVASMRRTFGKGKVYVTAFHPEAPQEWRDYYHLLDQDGLDFSFLEAMITWASASKSF